MSKRGRPPLGAELVKRMEGSNQARQKLSVILKTLSGEMNAQDAAVQLGISRSRFFALRDQWLQQSVASLEPKATGRPPREDIEQASAIEALRQEVQALKIDLRAAQIREELALLMPHVLKKNKAASPNKTKKNAASRRSRRPEARPKTRPQHPSDRSGDPRTP